MKISNSQLQNKAKALSMFFESMKMLKEEGILVNKKDFTCQIGEWLVETIYDGKRAESGIQKGWDVDVKGKHIQVKTHAKKEGNNNRWSRVEKDSTEVIDSLVIVVFTHDYKLKEFYDVPWTDAQPMINMRGNKIKKPEINWSQLSDFRVDISKLPRQEVIQLFI